MKSGLMLRRMFKKLFRRHGPVRSFEQEVQGSGGVIGGADMGTSTVDTRKIVGSVGRAQSLRSDFFRRYGTAVTARYERVGKAITSGAFLPPLELYRLRRAPPRDDHDKADTPSEYYVVDGHHRVAMARKLGMDFLDAHIVEYRLGDQQDGDDAPCLDTGPSAERNAVDPANDQAGEPE